MLYMFAPVALKAPQTEQERVLMQIGLIGLPSLPSLPSLPNWNFVVSTTPDVPRVRDGTTTLGQAAEAISNDLGGTAEHFLVYLNANGALTYEQNVIDAVSYVSLAEPLSPLWPTGPTGPRLNSTPNFSIDSSSVKSDRPLVKSLKARLARPLTTADI